MTCNETIGLIYKMIVVNDIEKIVKVLELTAEQSGILDKKAEELLTKALKLIQEAQELVAGADVLKKP
jgi:hypothetical protein